MKIGRTSFVLGFAAAVGALLAVGAVAIARPGSAGGPRSERAQISGVPSQAPPAILSAPRRPDDALPRALAASASALAGGPELAPEVRNGAVRVEASHLALSNLGAEARSFYIVPTAKGRVCVVITDGPQGCEEGRFDAAHPASWGMSDVDGYRHGTPTEVDGLVPNNAVRVTVVDDKGGRTDARVGNNAYYVELADGAAMPTSVVVYFAGGGSATVNLPKITVG